ncbi:hypothetical protein Nepgr_028461 [Nepenthes gracilis]|uniref:CCHC-type domain-containing protein n=1 Tax=Nepenthes gracilis TaxID=150966 RepID=A0AAD3TCE8_NEPGR|nr:hypothetical protein Nepgr_028461 [Nepenthes gracilis]
MSLRQGSMTVAQYEAQFIALSRFPPYLVDDEERKARRFQDGLNDVIQMQLLPFDLVEYSAVLKRAMIIEQALLRRGQIQQAASTPTGDRPQRSFLKKRPNARGQGGGGKQCFKCQKTGHIARYCNASSSAPTNPSSFSPAPTSREHQSPRTCYNCGKPGHFIKDCKAPKQGVPGTAGQQKPQRSGRVYAVTEQQARDSPDVVQD